jgi:uncharacterized membrane protein YsdA (DUF1294 family)
MISTGLGGELLAPEIVVSIVALINVWTFMLFGFDKLRAEAGVWRISESTLLMFATLGGLGGAYLGRRVFRHKTRKQPFSTHLHIIGVGWAFVGALATGVSLS